MPDFLSINEFLSRIKHEQPLLIDSRSEAEFKSGHIPGAVNIPLLNNEQRIVIGTTFKKQGRQEAVIKGFELVGPYFHEKILKAKELAIKSEAFVYCWRGGLRSNILSWLLSMSGFKITTLHGGYKSYRRWALSQFEIQRRIVVLGGKTGSGKTEMLQLLLHNGEQIICLESLANHKGSAFGSLGQDPQPTQEHFENLLAFNLGKINPLRNTWLENESRNIGFVKIPDALFTQIRNAPVVEMMVGENIRLKRILNEYADFPVELLTDKTEKLRKRMGGQNVKAAIECLKDNDKNGWVSLLLNYYDKTYGHSNTLRTADNVHTIDVDWKKPSADAQNIINISEKLIP